MYRWYALSLLSLTYIFSVMDRQILSILIEDLRYEFALSDTQLGLLSGIAFALFYASLGIPIARLADRWHRINIISVAVALWSLATALCGAVTSYAQLFAARVLVGVGEAGGSPPAHSVVSDYFEPARRSLAMSIYSLGATLGGVLGLVVGGFVAEYYGWRWAFVVLGLPGILLAALVKLTVKEPPRGRFDGPLEPAAPLGFLATIAELWGNLIYRRTVIAATLSTLVGYALFSWLAALYMRQFDLTQSVVGTIIGGLNLTCGLPGLVLGGYLADRLTRRDPRWRAWLPAVGLCFCLPLYLSAMWQDTVAGMSVCIGLGYFAYFINHAPPIALIQSVVRPEIRAQASAYLFFLANIVGLGIGPVIVGFVSDASADLYPDRSLNLALTVVMLGLIPSIFWFWRAGHTIGPQAQTHTGIQPGAPQT